MKSATLLAKNWAANILSSRQSSFHADYDYGYENGGRILAIATNVIRSTNVTRESCKGCCRSKLLELITTTHHCMTSPYHTTEYHHRKCGISYVRESGFVKRIWHNNDSLVRMHGTQLAAGRDWRSLSMMTTMVIRLKEQSEQKRTDAILSSLNWFTS